MDLLNHLRDLLHRLDRPDVRSVQALCKKVTGDHVAAQMLTRLLYWTPRSQSGWVYKSWRDWEAECGLTRAQIKRVHTQGLLEAVGVERQLMKACGAPTVHYRLDVGRLFAAIADCLGVAVETIEGAETAQSGAELGDDAPMDAATSDQWVEPEVPNGLGEDRPMIWAETAQSITSNQQINPTNLNNTDKQQASAVVVADQKVISELVGMGFSQPIAGELVKRYGLTRVEAVVAHTATMAVRNPSGFVRRALEQNWAVPEARLERGYDGASYVSGKYGAFIRQ